MQVMPACELHNYCFPEGILLGCVCFLMFASALSLEWLDGSQPNFLQGWIGSNPIENGRLLSNRLAAIVEKHCFPAPGGLILASSSSNRK